MKNIDSVPVILDRATQFLAQAKSVAEVKAFHSMAATAETYAKTHGLTEQAIAQCQIAKIQCEAWMGEYVAGMEKNKGSRGVGKKVQSNTTTALPLTLKDIGLTRDQSSRFQAIAAIPVAKREAYFATAKAAGEEITQAGLIRESSRLRTEEAHRNVKPVVPPKGQYRCIVIDPPWPIEKIEREVRLNQTAKLDYPTMSLEEIAKLPIPDLAYPDGTHVYMWITQRFLPDGLALFKAWGVKYQCCLYWVKAGGFTPFSWQYNVEPVLFGRIGSLKLEKLGIKLSFEGKRGGHSEKPEEFYDIVRSASPEPRIDMFSRRQIKGFKGWGNESL